MMTFVLPAQAGGVRLLVMDDVGGIWPGAETELLDQDDRVIRAVKADSNGEAVWTNLPLGAVRFRVKDRSAKPVIVPVVITDDHEQRLNVFLKVEAIHD